MNVTYEHRPAMTFIGFSTSIRPEEGYRKCPEFWDREYAQKYARLWQTMQPETAVEKAILENGVGLFAICDEKEGSFEYWIAGLYKGGDLYERRTERAGSDRDRFDYDDHGDSVN